MADIRNEVNAIRTAVYGEEVRSSIVNALEKLSAETDVGAFHEVKSGSVAVFENAESARLKNIVIYGASNQSGTPSPESPVAITTAGSSGSIDIVSAGKNLLRRFNNSSGTGANTTWTYDPDTGTYAVTATAGSGTVKLVQDNNTGLVGLKGVTLTLSVASITGDNNASVRVFSGDTELAMVYLSAMSATFTVPNNDPLSVVWRLGNATESGVTATFTGVQLEIGATRTEFAPIQDRITASLPTPNGLPGIRVNKGIGNFVDSNGQKWLCDTIDMKAGTYTKRIGVYTFSGIINELWSVSGTNPGFYAPGADFCIWLGLANNVSQESPHMTSWTVGREIATADGNNVQVGESYISGAPRLWIRTNHASVDALRAALAANPMTFLVPLATPTTSKLTDEQMDALHSLYTNRGHAAVYAANCAGVEVDAYIDQMKYITDYIDKKLAGSSTRTLAAAPMRSTAIPSDEPEPSDTDESSDADTSTDYTNEETPLSSMY